MDYRASSLMRPAPLQPTSRALAPTSRALAPASRLEAILFASVLQPLADSLGFYGDVVANALAEAVVVRLRSQP